MIKNIIFDFDGVIVDSEILASRAFTKYLNNKGHKVKEEDLYSYAGMKTILISCLLLFALLPAAAQPKMVDSTNYHYNAPQMGDYITFRILFEFSLRLKPDALQVLDLYIVPVLKQNPEIKFQIELKSQIKLLV